jgi:hypothetical protein
MMRRKSRRASSTRASSLRLYFITISSRLAGNANGVSFQSTNFPTMYLAPVTGQAEVGRLGIVANPDKDDASYTIVAGLTDATNYSISSLSTNPQYSGRYITLSAQIKAPCGYAPPSGDIYLDASGAGVTQTFIVGAPPPPPPPPPATLSVDTSAVDHRINKLFLGCHSDPGYTQEPRGWYSQLVYGESFEKGTTSVYAWNPITTNGATANVALDPSTTFNPNKPAPSLNVNFQSGNGVAGWSNRGIGNEGMYLVGGNLYDGYVFVLAPNGGSLYVAANDYVANNVLDSVTINVAASNVWQQIPFTLTPKANATCSAIAPGSNPNIDCGNMGPNAGHICVQCTGELQVGLSAPGNVHIGYVFFEPGPWGRFNNQPVLIDAVNTLQRMGITAIRQGGTVSQSFRWKDWRGVPWQRGSMGHVWGDSLVSGWGLFEMVDLCNAADIVPIITLAYDLNTVQDWADLVEYCWGDSSTTWGAIRYYNDSHPQPYNISIFELGNEQENPDFVQQVAAMEAKRVQIGAPPIHYMYPTNNGMSTSQAQAAIAAGLPISAIAPDCHVGGGGGVDCAINDFNNPPVAGFNQSFINCETNDAISTMIRAIHESSDLQTWFNVGEPTLHRLLARTASFCTERSG